MYSDIFLVGINHRSAGVDVRERFSLTGYGDAEHWPFVQSANLQESLLLSTCNRVEVLAAGTGHAEEQILTNWSSAKDAPVTDLRSCIYTYKNLEAVRHIFSVASSLDSMMVGEPQILGQLKKAYRQAVTAKKTGHILNRLLHKAFFVAKRVRTETAVATSAVSISYAAVELAKRIFDDMHKRKAMLIGAGEMAELAAKHLLNAGIAEIFVANRTYSRAEKLATQFRGHALEFDKMSEYLAQVDIVITSTAAEQPILTTSEIRTTLKKRKNSPMFLIDIAVPRNIDPGINEIDNVYLYDIDDLKEVVEENIANRADEARKASQIVDEETNLFGQWLATLDVQPTIVDLIERGEELARQELQRTLHKLPNLDAHSRQTLEVMLLSLTRKFNHAPLMFLKGESSHLDSAQRIEIVRQMFNLVKS